MLFHLCLDLVNDIIGVDGTKRYLSNAGDLLQDIFNISMAPVLPLYCRYRGNV